MQSCLALQMECAANGIEIHTRTLGNDADMIRVRSFLAEEFYQSKNYSHMLMIDGDNGFTPQRVMRLLEADLPLVSAPNPTKSIPGRWPVTLNGEQPVNGFLRCKEFPCNLALVARKVFDRMHEAYPSTMRIGLSGMSVIVHQWFLSHIRDGELRESAQSFLDRWHDIGGESWIDTESDVIHAGTHYFTGPGPMLPQWEQDESLLVGR